VYAEFYITGAADHMNLHRVVPRGVV
jgi:hypothetical protein